MKQSTKLLSLFLALVMCMSCFAVVGNAALSKSAVKYDSIDNAVFTAKQAADVLLDYVDEILPNDEIDTSVAGVLHLDTLNQLIPDVYNLLNDTTVGAAALLVTDIRNLRSQRSILQGWNRTDDPIGAVKKLLDFLSADDTLKVLKKVPYGLFTKDGITVGLLNGLVKSLVDVGEINAILTDLPGFLTKIVFDALLYGSYPYQGAAYDYESSSFAGLPTAANNIDKILNTAAFNILTKPQDNSWKDVNAVDANGVKYGNYTTAMGKGEVSSDGKQVKIWDMNSVVSKLFAKKGKSTDIDITSKSIIQILDTLLPYAYDEFGTHGLNHTLKKTIMEAMGVDFDEITYAELPEGAQIAFGTDVNASYCNYAMKDLLWQDALTGYWYYTDVRNRARDLDKDGEDDVDEDGNVIKDKTRVYFVGNPAKGNELMDLLDWDYAFDGTSFGTADTATGISGTISTYGSLFGSLNHLLFLILDIAGNDDVIKKVGTTIQDADGNVVWTDGANSNLNANLLSAVKFTLKNFAATIFGKGNAYVDEEGVIDADFLAQVNAGDLVDLVAYIGLPLFNDAMPQLIMPKNADGTFAFHDGVQVFEFGALVIREFFTDIAPALNYDNDIFSVLPEAGSRQFKTHSVDEWYNLILNMGLDVAYTYLNGYTNFNTAIPAHGITSDRWNGMFTAIVTWAVEFIGSGSSSALAKLAPNTVTAKGNGFKMLDYAFNTILPLGFISDCSGNGYDFDFEALFGKIKNLAATLDIQGIISLFGRNSSATDSASPNGTKMNNILKNTNVVKQVLDLAQRILYLVTGSNLLPATTNCATLLTSANISTLISNLLKGLDSRITDLLNNLLPVVILFFPEFSGEQQIGTPTMSLNKSVVTNSGSLSGATFNVSNGSKGVWRGYMQNGVRKQDNQYKYLLKGIKVYNLDGSVSSNVTVSNYPKTALDFGQSGPVTYNVTGIPTTGKVVRFELSYIVYNEEGQEMAGGKVFTVSNTIHFAYTASNERVTNTVKWKGTGDNYTKYSYVTDWYVPASDPAGYFGSGLEYARYDKSSTGLSSREYGVTCASNVNQGITLDKGDHGAQIGEVAEVTLYAKVSNSTTLKNYAESKKSASNSLTFTIKGYDKNATSGRSHNIVFHFYDDVYRNKLKSLVDSELSKMRLAKDYNTTGTAYAGAVLDTVADEDGLIETAFATTGINPDGDPEKEVTVINCATAWSSYISALEAASKVALQNWNGYASYGFEAPYKALYTASKDVNYLKKTAEQIASEGAENIDSEVISLANTLKGYNEAMANLDSTDYKSYRWERYITARSAARNIINAYKAQNYMVPDDEFFPYNTNVDEDTLDTLASQTAYSNYIIALKEAYTDEQQEARKTALDNAKLKYAGFTGLDVEQAQNLLDRTYARLIADNVDAELYFLNQEISSANVLYGTTNGAKGKTYSARSWDAYIAAYNAATAAAADGGNKSRFDAKYALEVAVNNLRAGDDEASYEELEALMEQAKTVLAGDSNYSNTGKEFGLLLAALGIDTDNDGKANELIADDTSYQLFPGSALIVNNTSYAADEQKKVDKAADALRAALAAMKFKNVTITDNGVGDEVILGKDAEDNAITATDIATIAQKLTPAEVKDLFTVTAEDKVVSLNGTYALIDKDPFGSLTGTGSTITFYNTVSGVKVPIATIRLIVKGDVNGDGAVDVLDTANVMLVTNELATLKDVYWAAANAVEDDELGIEDYGEVVNIALAG